LLRRRRVVEWARPRALVSLPSKTWRSRGVHVGRQARRHKCMMHGSLRPGSSCGTTAASVHSAPLMLRRRFILWAGLHDFARGVQTRRYRLAWGAVTSLESTMVLYRAGWTATAADVADSAFFFLFRRASRRCGAKSTSACNVPERRASAVVMGLVCLLAQNRWSSWAG
jgi:hypothetical protein